MALTVGSQAPDFTLVTLGENGPELFKLSEALKEGPLVLAFFPLAFTGVCTTEFCSLTTDADAYQNLNARVYGVSGDSPFAQKEWAEKEGIKIPLLSDYDHQVTQAFGIAYDSFLPEKNLIFGGVPKRSAFLIDQNGVVQFADVKESPGDLPDFDALKKALANLS